MRKTIVKSISWILCIILCMAIAQPMNAGAEEKEEITVMLNISEEVMEPYIAAFERKYPYIMVK
ncbi:MAG: hypothetical protein ACI4R6_07370, partial [Lachnospiraceae bacterium]